MRDDGSGDGVGVELVTGCAVGGDAAAKGDGRELELFELHITLRVQTPDGSALASARSELEEISRILRSHSEASSSQTRVISLLNVTLSPVNPSSSAPSNGTSSPTPLT